MKSFSNKETEINKAIIEWIKNLGFDKTYNSLLEETGISPNDIPKTKVLDKKWNTILLMQKKINDLELELKNVKEEVDYSKANGISYGNKQNTDIQMVGYFIYFYYRDYLNFLKRKHFLGTDNLLLVLLSILSLIFWQVVLRMVTLLYGSLMIMKLNKNSL